MSISSVKYEEFNQIVDLHQIYLVFFKNKPQNLYYTLHKVSPCFLFISCVFPTVPSPQGTSVYVSTFTLTAIAVDRWPLSTSGLYHIA